MSPFYAVAVSIKFKKSSYSTTERKRPVEIILVLSNPSSTDIVVIINSTDITATGT